MKFSKNYIAIFFLNKNRGTFLTNKEPKGIKLDFPKEILSHLEILDKSKLKEFIHKFLERNKIKPSKLFIVLGEETTFEKDITGISYPELTAETQKFLDIIPFEEALSKVFKIQKKIKIVVANKRLCEELSDVFETEGFSVTAIIPFSLILEINPMLKKNTTQLLRKLGVIKQYSLLSPSSQSKSLNIEPSSLNTRVVMLVSVFVILFTILIVLILN